MNLARHRLIAAIYNRPLKLRIFVLCLAVAVFSTGLVAMFSYIRAVQVVQTNAYAQADQTVRQAASYLDASFRNILGQVSSLVTSTAFTHVVEVNGALSAEEKIVITSELQSVFSGLRIRDHNIVNAYLYTPTGGYYELTFQPNPDFTKTRTFAEAQQDRTLNHWLSPRDDEVFVGTGQVIPLIVPLSFGTVGNQTFLVVNISEQRLIDYLNTLNPNGLIYVALPDNSPALVPNRISVYSKLPADPDFVKQLNGSGSIDYGAALVNYTPIPSNGWKVISIDSKSTMTAGLGDIQRFTLLVASLSLLLASVLSTWLATTITKPLSALIRLMRRVEARDLDVRFNSRYRDEVGELGGAFNAMIEEISQLIHRVEQEQRAKRVAELHVLQAQINPHFLYNTLDSIYWKAKLGETEVVAEMAVALSTLFRLGLNGGREVTTLRHEFDHVRSYLDIQKLCYGKFEYQVNLPPTLDDLPIVKLILQPLVENSLTHGFQGMQQTGQIGVSGQVVDGWLRLEVVDNGCGFDPATVLAALDSACEIHADGHGYALRNVHARLKLHYGEGFRLNIESQPFQRTMLRIELALTSANSLPAPQKYPVRSSDEIK